MKTLELEEMGLLSMSDSEIRNTEGGILVGLWNLTRFIIGEGADFVTGVGEGYTWATTFNLKDKNKTLKFNYMKITEFGCQELMFNEQQSINGGSAVTTLAGRLVGAIAGGIADVYTAWAFINDNSCD